MWIKTLSGIVAVGLFAVGCSRGPDSAKSTENQPAKVQYKEPRFPSYLRPPSSIDEVLPYVRPLVRAKTGLQGAGLGVVNPGESILIVTSI